MGDFEGAPPFGGVPFEVVSVPQPKENRLPIINPASSFFTVWPSFLVLKGSVIESAGGEPAAKEKIHNAFIYSQKKSPAGSFSADGHRFRRVRWLWPGVGRKKIEISRFFSTTFGNKLILLGS
jgi:hypothetical protein